MNVTPRWSRREVGRGGRSLAPWPLELLPRMPLFRCLFVPPSCVLVKGMPPALALPREEWAAGLRAVRSPRAQLGRHRALAWVVWPVAPGGQAAGAAVHQFCMGSPASTSGRQESSVLRPWSGPGGATGAGAAGQVGGRTCSQGWEVGGSLLSHFPHEGAARRGPPPRPCPRAVPTSQMELALPSPILWSRLFPGNLFLLEK